MIRFSSFRDFDWPLLGLVSLLSIISVLEIKSATLHTKFHGFDHKQIGFLAIGHSLPVLALGAGLIGLNAAVFTPLSSGIAAEFGDPVRVVSHGSQALTDTAAANSATMSAARLIMNVSPIS